MKSIVSRIIDFLTPKPKPTELQVMAEKIRIYRQKYMELARLAHQLPECDFKSQALLILGLMRKNLETAEGLFEQHRKLAEQQRVVDMAEKMLLEEDAMRGGL